MLYRRIQEQIRQENKAVETIKQIPENDLSRELRLFINLNELLEKEKLYTDPTLNRDDLAQRLGTNRTYLMEAVRTYSGNMTVREYIYDFRLKHAAELLSSPSASRSIKYAMTPGSLPARYFTAFSDRAMACLLTNIENLRRKKKKIKILYFKNLRHTDKCLRHTDSF